MELFEDESGKPRGCGIIEFEKHEHALLAMDRMNRYELKGRKLVVKEVRTILGSSAISLELSPHFYENSVHRKDWKRADTFILVFLFCFVYLPIFFPWKNCHNQSGESAVE